MQRWPVLLLACAGVVAGLASPWSLVPLGAAPQQPTFRSTVDLVAVDVSIVDGQGRPVDDLRPEEFTLKVDGRPRRLSSAAFINLRRTRDDADPERAAYSTNQHARPGRRILIVVDEANIHQGNGRTVMRAAADFIDGLNPSDRVSLEFIPGTGPLIGFTANHRLVTQLLANGVGKMIEASASSKIGLSEAMVLMRDGQNSKVWADVIDRECIGLENVASSYVNCKQNLANEARLVWQEARAQATNSLLSLRAIVERMRGARTPTTLVLITEGLVVEPSSTELNWVAPATSSAQINLFALALDGSFADASMQRISPTHYEDRQLYTEGLDRLTASARGAVLPIAVSAKSVFARLDLEISGYYLLSFEPDLVDRDGKPHDISVSVSRPGVTVRSRPQFAVMPTPPARTPEQALVDTFKNPLPVADVGMKLTTYTYRDDASKKLKVLVSVEVDRSLNRAGEFAFGYIVTDARGALAASQFETLTPASRDDEGRPQRYSGAVVLDPGIYTVKAAAADGDGHTGSVERTFEAKLTTAGPLRLGDLLLADVVGRLAKPTVDGRIAGGTVMAYAEIYGDRNGPLSNVALALEVGRTDVDAAIETAPMRFTDRKGDGTRTAEGAIPVAMLASGDYVARVVATLDGKNVGRATRPFTVTHAAVTTPVAGPAPSTTMSSGTRERITFAAPIEAFDPADVLEPRVIGFFVDRMHMVGLPAMPAALEPAIAAAKAARFAELTQSLTTAPATHPVTSFLSGLARLSQGDLDGADMALRAALAASPDFFPASFYLGAALAARGRDADAISVWQTALITETNAPFVYTLLGDAMLRAKRTADAIGLLREAVILWPDVDSVAMRLGTALAQGGAPAEALTVLDPYLATHPADEDRLLLAMRLIYTAASAGTPIESAAQDKARFARYFAAYEKTGGPQLALVAEWKKIVDRHLVPGPPAP